MKSINRFDSKLDFDKFEEVDPKKGILIEDILLTDSFIYISPQALGIVGSEFDVNVLLARLFEHFIENNVSLDFFEKYFRKEFVKNEE